METEEPPAVGMSTAGDNTAIHRIAYVGKKIFRTTCGRLVPRQPQQTQEPLPRCPECWADES
jgi:hypothetical protein